MYRYVCLYVYLLYTLHHCMKTCTTTHTHTDAHTHAHTHTHTHAREHRQICWCPNADVNECQTGQYQCEEICANNIGSYECSCNPGNVLGADGLSCEGMRTTLYMHYTSNVVVCMIIVCVHLIYTYTYIMI